MMLFSIYDTRLRQRAAAALGVGGALLLVACASTAPEPTAALQAAEQAIGAADQTRTADASSPELSEAREKLRAAHRAVADERMVDAERLALESRVDAELASARIEAAKARAVNEEIKRSTQTLMEEMQRKPGASQ